MKHTKRGFTLIELLIVIVVIAILALIVIPRLLGATRAAKESTLKANLDRLRGAVNQFNADMGVFPDATGGLADLVAANKDALAGGYTESEKSMYKGPYLDPKGGCTDATGIPFNPFVDLKTPANRAWDANWDYDATNGTVSCDSAIVGETSDGIAYTAL